MIGKALIDRIRRRGGDADPCDAGLCEHDHSEDPTNVSLGLIMPTPKAEELLREIDSAKRAGDPYAVNINVMYIAVMSACGPVKMPETGEYGRRFTVAASRSTSKGIRLLFPLAVLVGAYLAGLYERPVAFVGMLLGLTLAPWIVARLPKRKQS
jgi:hypothetical protein